MISSNHDFEVLDEFDTDWHQIYDDEVAPVKFRIKTVKYGMEDYTFYQVICEDNLEMEDNELEPKLGLDVNINMLSQELFDDINAYYDNVDQEVLTKIKEKVKSVLTDVIEAIEEDKKV